MDKDEVNKVLKQLSEVLKGFQKSKDIKGTDFIDKNIKFAKTKKKKITKKK